MNASVVHLNQPRSETWRKSLYKQAAADTGFSVNFGKAFGKGSDTSDTLDQTYFGVSITRPPSEECHSPFWRRMEELERKYASRLKENPHAERPCPECQADHAPVSFCEKCHSCLYKNSEQIPDEQFPLHKCTKCGHVNFWD